jgi:DNA repair exonuclease SbcCD ATPase subunit
VTEETSEKRFVWLNRAHQRLVARVAELEREREDLTEWCVRNAELVAEEWHSMRRQISGLHSEAKRWKARALENEEARAAMSEPGRAAREQRIRDEAWEQARESLGVLKEALDENDPVVAAALLVADTASALDDVSPSVGWEAERRYREFRKALMGYQIARDHEEGT